MGVWIEPEPGEPIEDVLRRFRRAICAEGAYPLCHCKWHKKQPRFFDKPSTLNRRRRWITRIAKKGYAISSEEPDLWWADDLCLRPRRSYGPIGSYVAT